MIPTASAVPTAPRLAPRLVKLFLDRIEEVSGSPRADLEMVVADAERLGLPLQDALVSFGRVDETTSYQALSEVTRLPLVSVKDAVPSPLAVRMVPSRLAQRLRVVPLSVTDKTLQYATSMPFDMDAERDIAFLSGRRPEPQFASRSDVDALFDRAYPRPSDLDSLVEKIRSSAVIEPLSEFDASHTSDSAVIDLCNHLVARAVDAGASDIHIECTHEGAVARFRIGGVMEAIATIPPTAAPAVSNRFKIMARADIAVRMKPQDGAFALQLDGRRIDVRFSSVPTITGEKLVMRVIDSRSPLQGLDQLGYHAELVDRLKRALARPDGLVLVTGPTGCGKTTALYAALDLLRTRALNIVSVEDPVERRVTGVTQIPVNPRAGATFASVLRSLLRQDPNVIMVGEIRDPEVAGILGQAAYTGHLVLSSLHTTDSVTAIVRLMNLGLEPFKIAESLSGILAQRLVRKLCPECKVPASAAVEPGDTGAPPVTGAFAIGPGCPACRFSGYAGRTVLAELLTPDSGLREVIARGASAAELRAAMRAAGVPTMQDRAHALVAEGLTTIGEVERVLATGDVTPHARPGRSVLVADDDTMTRMLVKLLLEREGYTVLEAGTGRQAVEIAVREHPSLIVMDLNMPEMSGYDAINHVRRAPSLAAVPLLVLTAEEGPGVETSVLQLGADDYILKPFDPGVLLSRVQAAFRRVTAAAA